MFGDLARIPKDPIGAITSTVTDPLNQVRGSGVGNRVKIGGDLAPSKSGGGRGVDQLSPEEIRGFLAEGRQRGESLTGIKSDEVGRERRGIREQYRDILNQPSRGAERVAQARNASLKRLRQQQAGSGVSGARAQAQEMALSQDYARQAGDVRQREYLDALNKLETQFRGAGTDIMRSEGQYGSIGVGSKPTPIVESSGITYLCTELKNRGMITKMELFFIHFLLVLGTILRPAQTYYYLKYGKKLVNEMIKDDHNWRWVKIGLFDICLKYMAKGRFIKAINHYETITRQLFSMYGMGLHLSQFNFKWSLKRLKDSFKLIIGVYYGSQKEA